MAKKKLESKEQRQERLKNRKKIKPPHDKHAEKTAAEETADDTKSGEDESGDSESTSDD